MDRTERFYRIDRLLRESRAVTIDRFLDELSVSRATFKRDLEYMRDRLNAPIEWDRDTGGYRLAEQLKGSPDYELPGLPHRTGHGIGMLYHEHEYIVRGNKTPLAPGMCFTDDEQLAEIMGSVRVHGKGHHKYDNVRIGVNGRLDTIQAGILLAKLDIFPEEIELRQQVADRYTSLLNPISSIQTPAVPQSYKSAWAQYSVLTTDETQRTDLQNKLKEVDIPTAIYYPKPLHLQNAFAGLGYRKGDFPISEDISGRIFSLPMHPYLAEEAQQKIAGVIDSTVAGE